MQAKVFKNNVHRFSSVESFEKEKMPESLFWDRYPWEGSVKNIDKIVIRLKNGIKSNAFILHPNNSNRLNIPIIYHGGHGGAFWEDKYWNNDNSPHPISVFKFFLDRGFDVITFDMPLIGENKTLYLLNRDTETVFIKEHADLFELREPFYYFFGPVKQTIDLLENEYGYSNFAMIGLSGGGWATTLYSAMDTRIVHSYAVAGSVPIPLRKKANDWGDEEQNNSEFYNEFNYSVLYTLAAAGPGRLHFQILNKYDQCCYAMDGEQWKGNVVAALNKVEDKGNYKFFFDTSANKHMISSVTLDTIYASLRNDFLSNSLPFQIKITGASSTVLYKQSPNKNGKAAVSIIGAGSSAKKM
ncbi:MAG: hypothetical protein EOP53_21970 [Sphingobacteriales bacterium]|nr:MAG: hypothetical protein EOP53_21970 [Sphingobacteriales bacterium]